MIGVGGLALVAGCASFALAVHEIGVGGSLLALVPGLVLVGAGIGLCFSR